MTRIWFLDGKEVDFRVIVRKAREYGYESTSGIYLTSEASRILEDNGHQIKCKKIDETQKIAS